MKEMKELGYSKEEVIQMTKRNPSIYGCSIENIKEKIEGVIELGYSQEEVIKMTNSLPTFFSYSIENIKEKIDFYNLIGLGFIVIEDTKQLIQSTKLSYARYMFLKEEGIEINKTNYRKLFIGEKQFKKQYGLTNKEIVEKYPYEAERKKKENEKTNIDVAKGDIDNEKAENELLGRAMELRGKIIEQNEKIEEQNKEIEELDRIYEDIGIEQ
jgi:hypothetical protein